VISVRRRRGGVHRHGRRIGDVLGRPMELIITPAAASLQQRTH